MVVWCTQNLRRDGCSFMWHQPYQRCKYTTLVDIQKTRYKKLVILNVEPHASAVSLLKRAENSAMEAIISQWKVKKNAYLMWQTTICEFSGWAPLSSDRTTVKQRLNGQTWHVGYSQARRSYVSLRAPKRATKWKYTTNTIIHKFSHSNQWYLATVTINTIPIIIMNTVTTWPQ